MVVRLPEESMKIESKAKMEKSPIKKSATRYRINGIMTMKKDPWSSSLQEASDTSISDSSHIVTKS